MAYIMRMEGSSFADVQEAVFRQTGGFKVYIRVRNMLKAKADEQTGTEILMEAISKDKVHLARFVLDALDGEIIDSRVEGARTPLISSILLPDNRARCKFIELLLQKGAGVNHQDGNGRTALSYACERGYLDAVKILVRHGADPEVEDCWGNTALMYAAAAGRFSVLQFVVRAFKRLGLQVDRQNKAGNSAVEVAKFLGHRECVCALSNSSSRSREEDGGAPRRSSGSESKVAFLADKLELLQTSDRARVVQNPVWQSRPRMRRNRFRSMDSIEEFGGEDLVLSGALTPVPPPRTEERSRTSEDHLPSLVEVQKTRLFSQQPNRTTAQPGAPSVLGVLLTPLTGRDTERGKEKSAAGFKLNDSYYRKRFSLPTGALNPTPPERALVPARKSRKVRRRDAPPTAAAPLEFPTSAAEASTLSVLSNKLFRRFTSPEIKGDSEDPEQETVSVSYRIPRSETFPQEAKHRQVDVTNSVDSISSVTCEFDLQLRNSSKPQKAACKTAPSDGNVF